MLPDETNFDVSRRNLLRYRHDNCKTSRAQQNRNMTAVRRFMTLVAAALLAGTMTALAQDVTAVQDAPLLTVDEGLSAADSLYSPPPMFFAVPSAQRLPSLLRPDIPVSQEDRAIAVNFAVHAAVTASVAESMKAVPMVDIIATTGWMPFANPFAIPYGYVPLGNSSNPFIIAKIPGWNPEPDKYSPEAIPQCIKLEYDFATGTYRQVMVSWEEYTRQMAKFPANIQTDPVPAVPVTPVERAMRQ